MLANAIKINQKNSYTPLALQVVSGIFREKTLPRRTFNG
jgi:hypothetical protein